jgi:putative PIN family toxin of toxin-antitoxin system
MIRVVLDTNILISALLSPAGLPTQVFWNVLLKLDGELCMSGPIYAEYEEVMRRPRLKRTEEEIQSALRAVRENALWVIPTISIRACTDPDDNIFLECAQAAAAHYLVTGNVRHFPSTYGGTKIVTAREFLNETA